MVQRLAIFGDSFCSLNLENQNSWPNVLQKLSGYEIKNFGKPATGIMWSYHNLLEHADEYDWNIWCVSSIQRLTIEIPYEPWIIHYNGPGCSKNYKSTIIVDILQACDDFFIKVDIYQDLKILYHTLIMAALDRWPNLMIIPCFQEPLMCDSNLSDISLKELSKMKGAPKKYVFSDFHDRRPCHLTEQNNKILAETIWENRGQKLLSLDLADFIFDQHWRFDNYFHKV